LTETYSKSSIIDIIQIDSPFGTCEEIVIEKNDLLMLRIVKMSHELVVSDATFFLWDYTKITMPDATSGSVSEGVIHPPEVVDWHQTIYLWWQLVVIERIPPEYLLTCKGLLILELLSSPIEDGSIID
jgi:hypothetical protein